MYSVEIQMVYSIIHKCIHISISSELSSEKCKAEFHQQYCLQRLANMKARIILARLALPSKTGFSDCDASDVTCLLEIAWHGLT